MNQIAKVPHCPSRSVSGVPEQPVALSLVEQFAQSPFQGLGRQTSPMMFKRPTEATLHCSPGQEHGCGEQLVTERGNRLSVVLPHDLLHGSVCDEFEVDSEFLEVHV
jgi:hypothetical protein